MRILYYDCQAGISGDMNLAAMLDLGVDVGHLRAELGKLGLDAAFSLRVGRETRNGIAGTRVDVDLAGEPPADHDHPHGHCPAPEHGEQGHEAHDHYHAHDHAHGGRNLAAITALIEASALSDAVKGTSLAIFHRVAAAEAKVHGTTIDEVHFHEVGAIDSIVDIVGAAVCFHALGVDAVWASPVELGGGFVRCAHGLIPVPAPATAEILTGIPTSRGATPHETATPTGAAIVAELATQFTATPRMTVKKTGYGVGHRVTELPNLLRVHLAEATVDAPGWSVSQARLLQCNIDDMTAETLGAVMDTLMAAGAMDVHFTPIVMKKNRPATCLSLLCAAADEDRFKALVFRHTTTLGIKSLPLDKTVLETTFTTLETSLGPVTLKNALLGGKVLRAKPEFEDCRELARRHNLPLTAVYAAVGRAMPGEEEKDD